MCVKELNRDQLIELKIAYMTDLVNEGTFAFVIGRDYGEPSWADLVEADEIIPDEVVIEHFSGYNFGPEDFFCSTVVEERRAS